MRKAKFLLISLSAIILIVLVGCSKNANNGASNGTGAKITVYKSPDCNCCAGYVSELKKYNFDVEVIPTGNLNPIKEEHNIPNEVQSCHTAVIGNYFVEGHVPVEAINKMINEKPDISGIALPKMPPGSPGMPGRKAGPWVIYALKDGEKTEFMTI